MMMEAQLRQPQKKQQKRQPCRVFNAPHSILDTSGQDKRVDLTFYQLGRCLQMQHSYSDVLKAFVGLQVNKQEDYAKKLSGLSHARLQQWRAYFHNPWMIQFWQALRLIETHHYLAYQRDPELQYDPMNPTKPFDQDYLMSVLAQLTNMIYAVYEGII